MKKKENAWTPHSATVYVLLHSHVPSLTFFSFENMFSSFIMKLAVGKEIVNQVYKSLLYTVSAGFRTANIILKEKQNTKTSF